MSRQKGKTAAELMAELEKDPVYLEQRRQRDEQRQQKEEEYARAEAPIVKDLREAGVSVSSVWDLVNSTNTYVESLPILLEHLQRPYPDAVREGIARAMAVPEAKYAWTLLVELYQKEQSTQARAGLAVALSNIADDDTLDELIGLAMDVKHGESRLLLLNALERSSVPQAKKALMKLGGDPSLHREAQAILRRLK